MKATSPPRRTLTSDTDLRNKRRKLSPYERATVASDQEWRCNACGVLFKALWHVDHIVRLSDGGADERENMQALCADCHADKTAVEALSGCIRVVRLSQQQTCHPDQEMNECT